MRKEDRFARFTRVRALLGACGADSTWNSRNSGAGPTGSPRKTGVGSTWSSRNTGAGSTWSPRSKKTNPMRGRRKGNKLLSLMGWNLLVWVSAAQLSVGLAAPAQVAANAATDQQPQIEKGRQAVGEVCAACHTNILRMVQIYKKSPDQWKDTVYSMIGRGAQLRPDEIEAVTAFLAATSARNLAANADVRRGAGGAETDGRAILQRNCQQCHELATATTKLPSEEWSAVIAKMMTYGAKLTTADQQKLVDYLNGLAK
jgi:mono/diheme cytochrome c family protein